MNRRTFLERSALAYLAVPLGVRSLHEDFFRSQDASAGHEYSASMWTYLWDIVDEGYENVLGRLKDNKLTSVSLATAYHAGKFLAPHNPKEKVVFLEDGTVYFQPTSSLYHRIQPRVNSLVNRGEGLEKLRSLAEHRGLETRAWVVCCHNTPLGMQYPDIACRDVFGDAIYHNLCPSNPDVRSYLGSLVKDIASKGVTVIELEAMQFPPRFTREGYLDINPLGTVPTLTDGDVTMTESAGICQYLVDCHGPTEIGLTPKDHDYGLYLNWLHRSDATLTFPQTIVLPLPQQLRHKD